MPGSMYRFPQIVMGWLTVVAAVALSAAATRAQTAPPVDAGAGPLALLLPKVASAPAPAWVKPGLRLSYYGASATVAGAGKQWTLDPEGNFVSPDGRHWSGADKIGGAGQGITHYDVIAAGQDKVSLATSTYLLIPGQPASLSTTGVASGPPGAMGDLWVNPEALKRLANRKTGALFIYRAPYKIGAEAKPSVWIHTTTNSGYTAYVYEEATGLMIHYSAATTGPPSPVYGRTEGSNTPNTFLVTTTLVAKRTLDLPWASDPAPSWVAGLHTLDYSGTLTTYVPGAPGLSLPASTRMTVAARGSSWVRFRKSSSFGGGRGLPPQTSQSEAISGGHTVGVWISPDALARLKPGQQIDRDAPTGIVTSVGRPASTPQGKPLTVITMANSGEQTDLGYDRETGMLVYISFTQRVPPATNVSRMFLTGRE
ncbi:MAG TPA: hypothetical protein VKT77_05545 [Chthonomonadaceae bacterium]|nr:hypothetical protein [Chthonomonadaceae bacterium]